MDNQTRNAYRHLVMYLQYHFKWYEVASPISGDDLARLKAGYRA